MTGTLLALGQFAAAQTPAVDATKPNAENSGGGTAMPEMVVQGDFEKPLYTPERLSSPKITQPLRDVAQTVTVIPKDIIKEQNASSLRDVLRNVPGISMQAGEGGGGPSGDNLAIRGFAARSDIFVDGMRDTAGGGYARDPFNFEQVEVTKGPSSASAGRGSTGGSINIVTKAPHAGNSYGAGLTGGTDNFYRGTVDLNQEIPGWNGAAARFNGMYHSQDIAGRDGVSNERWGVAPSFAIGIGTDTRFTMSYMHLEADNTPDYGIPWVPRNTATARNKTGLPSGILPDSYFDRWYGNKKRDREEIQTDILSAAIEHDFNEDFKLTSRFRYGRNERDQVTTAPRFVATPTTDAAGNTVNEYNSTALNQQFQSRDQVDWGIGNQTDIRYDFHTGPVKHMLVGGFELSREDSRNWSRGNYVIDPATGGRISAPTPQVDLITGNVLVPYTGFIARNGAYTDASVDSASAYLFDTAEINKNWEVSGGVRFDSNNIAYRNIPADNPAPTTPTEPFRADVSDEMWSYRGAVTYKPVQEGSIYLAYGTSFNPSTELLTYGTSAANVNVDPEKNETIELGAKWEFLDEKLLVSGAVFQTEKTNARTTDPVTQLVTLTGEQEVRGFETGFTGSVTDTWRLIGGYTFLDSEVKESAVPSEIGSEISNTPKHSFSLWTVHDLPKGFTVGLGAQYVGNRFSSNNSDTRQLAPNFFLVNAMAGYQLNENVSFRLNVDNLLDEEYLDRVGGGHAVPGAGRTISLTADFSF